ncbi:MAG TPA: sigma-70 family RNA polymerase sigma factor [Acidimicrobiales bacterium]
MSGLPGSGAVTAEQLEEYRRELTGYCYRMLGSIHEAEDAVQDAMLRAWRALDRFEDREGLRPWLYRIATNVCIDLSKGRARRALPMDVAAVQTGELVRGDARPEAFWVGPAPDQMVLSGGDPEDQALSRESVRIAFIAALQHLAPRQRAVLILRDVLRWRAAEVAVLLETSTTAVNSALRRAREAIDDADRDLTPSEPAADDHAVLAAYIDAFERDDVEGLVALLREDAILEMPPFELWMRGPADIRKWMLKADAFGQERFAPVGANGSPAVAVYRPREPGGVPQAFSVQVLDVVDGRIGAIHVFLDPTLFGLFGLPSELGD